MASDHPPRAQWEPESRVSRAASSPGRDGPPGRGRTWGRIDSVPGGIASPLPARTPAWCGGRVGEGEDGAGGPSLTEPGQGRLGRHAPGDDHGRHRGPGGRFEGILPALVDLHQVEKDPDHPVDAREQLGSGRTPGLVEGPLEGVGPGHRPVVLQFGLAEGPLGRFEPGGGPPVGGLGLGHRGLQLMAGLLRLGQPLPQLVVLPLEDGGPALGRGQPDGQLIRRAPVALQRVLEGSELAAGHGDRLVGAAELGSVPPRLQVGFELAGHLLLDGDEGRLLRGQRRRLGLGGLQLLGQPGALGLEGRDHVGVGRGVEGLGQGALPLPEHPGQAAGPLDHPLGPSEGGGQVGLALGGHLVGRPLGVGVQLAEGTRILSSASRCSFRALVPSS